MNSFLFKTKQLPLGALMIVLAVFLVGCGGSYKSASGGSTYDYAEQLNYAPQESLEGFESDGAAQLGYTDSKSAAPVPQSNRTENSTQPNRAEPSAVTGTAVVKERKLIKKADLNIEADKSLIDNEGKLSGVNQKVDELLKKYGAYTAHTRSDENTAHFTLKVPQIHYESLIAGAGELGKIRSRSETAEDVTMKYYDLEGRLNTRKVLLETFQGYLGRAKDIDDIMKVETRIAELQNEIDWMGTQLAQLSNLVDYATVELSVYSYHYTPDTFGDTIGNIFKSFGGFASGVLAALLTIIIYGIPIAVICFLAFWLLFGRVGIVKKAFHLAMGTKPAKTGSLKSSALLDKISKQKNENTGNKKKDNESEGSQPEND